VEGAEFHMAKTIIAVLFLSTIVLFLSTSCAYKPTVKIEATVPSDIISKAVTAAIYPKPDTVWDTLCVDTRGQIVECPKIK
jgi:hypothetical protein